MSESVILWYTIPCFSFLIKKFNFKTPGREDNDDEVKLYTRKDVEAKKNGGKAADGAHVEGELSAQICAGLGGKKNISDVDCCATRLRCTVFEAAKVNDALLKATGASGVIHKGQGVQIIYGPKVTVIKSNLEDYLEHAPKKKSHLTCPMWKNHSRKTQSKTEKEGILCDRKPV